MQESMLERMTPLYEQYNTTCLKIQAIINKAKKEQQECFNPKIGEVVRYEKPVETTVKKNLNGL